MAHLLVVDDEPHFRNTLLKALKSQGCRATGIPGPEFLPSTIAIQRPDVILLDLNFEAGTGGIDACAQLRRWSSIPVIVISVSDDEATKVRALSTGADDYLVKPFGIQELLARIDAIQRRLQPRYSTPNPTIQIRNLTVNLNTRSVTLDGNAVDLTRKEYQLLALLARVPGELVTYQMLANELWPHDAHDLNRGSAIRTLVKRLRQKLGDDLARPNYVLTQSGMGFRLNSDLPQVAGHAHP